MQHPLGPGFPGAQSQWGTRQQTDRLCPGDEAGHGREFSKGTTIRGDQSAFPQWNPCSLHNPRVVGFWREETERGVKLGPCSPFRQHLPMTPSTILTPIPLSQQLAVQSEGAPPGGPLGHRQASVLQPPPGRAGGSDPAFSSRAPRARRCHTAPRGCLPGRAKRGRLGCR